MGGGPLQTQLIEHDTYREEVRRHVPSGQIGVGRLIGGCAGLCVDGVTDPRGDVEVEQLAPVRVSMTFSGLMSR